MNTCLGAHFKNGINIDFVRSIGYYGHQKLFINVAKHIECTNKNSCPNTVVVCAFNFELH